MNNRIKEPKGTLPLENFLAEATPGSPALFCLHPDI